jgi:acyl carrier protein
MDNTLQLTFEQFAVIVGEKLRIPREQIQPETALKDIEIDSLAIIEVMLAVESQFGASIPTEEVSTDGKAEDLYQLVVAAVDASRK